ncbi:MAG: PEP-CTERM sorting domain-containing protein [Planctomycetia bacterium]|nr:PEP-CTERM sorting domain-containing protein [Planctomycetia bacterium]
MVTLVASASAQTHPSAPAFNSSPGAPYTVYLDFGGFSFNGDWGNNASYTPGITPAYDTDGNATSFSTFELGLIQKVWSRVSEKYAPFNVNVTTVDPAVAAGQATNDTQRQDYYDNQARMMHTVIGGSGAWSGGGGVSYVGVTQNAQPFSNGYHTDWVFAAQNPGNLQFIGEAAAHENGHGFGLLHQSDYSGDTLVNEYSLGTGTGFGSKAPIMGNSYSAERGTWKNGTAHVNSLGPTTQNDPRVILNNLGLGSFINDGVGHSRLAATPLPLMGTSINASLARGVIVPASSASPAWSGEASYVADYWSFTTGTGSVSITAHAGRSTITPGVSDPGATLDSTLRILDATGAVVASSATTFLNETLSLVLPAGNYYAQVVSAADPNNTGFYDMGSYFLTGNIIAVPEPSTLALLAAGLIAPGWVRRKRRRV